MCSKLWFWGYVQIAQICENGWMFVQGVHADNISDWVGFLKGIKKTVQTQ